MTTPESSIEIMASFQRAVKTGDTAEIDRIPLGKIKLAKAHFSCDSNQPFYVFMLDYIQERGKMEESPAGKISIEKKDFIFISHIGEEASIALLLPL